MEYVNFAIILILSLIGIVNIIKSVILLLCEDNENNYNIVVSIDDNCENPETVIRNAVLYHEWSDNNKNKYSGIYCIYKGENEEAKEICRRVCEDYPFTHYISNPEFLIGSSNK